MKNYVAPEMNEIIVEDVLTISELDPKTYIEINGVKYDATNYGSIVESELDLSTSLIAD